jgi:hypothetical protein
MSINKVIIVIGRRGSGKTDFLKKCVKHSTLPKKLIIDHFNSEVWSSLETFEDPLAKNHKIPQIKPTDFPNWEKGIYRIFEKDTDSTMKIIDECARNTLLVFDDATIYIGKQISKEVKTFILDSKQKNLNIIFAFHSVKDVPADIFRYSDYVTFFEVVENLKSSVMNKLPVGGIEALTKVNAMPKYSNITIEI